MTATTEVATPQVPAHAGAAADVLIRLADDDLLTGHVLTSLAGWGPELEINIALSSMGQDELGHARRLYALVTTGPEEAERLVYERPAADFRAAPLARTYPAPWELLLARQYLYETADAARAAVLARTIHGDVAALVSEMAHEESYHLDFWTTWLRTTTARSAAARERVQHAVDLMWPLAVESFLPEHPEPAEPALGLPRGALARAKQEWISATSAACAELGIELRDGDHDPALDRLDAMLDEMRCVYRTAPGRW